VRSHFEDLSYSNPGGGMFSSVNDMISFMKHQISLLDELKPEKPFHFAENVLFFCHLFFVVADLLRGMDKVRRAFRGRCAV
jgi:hypothetical protein